MFGWDFGCLSPCFSSSFFLSFFLSSLLGLLLFIFFFGFFMVFWQNSSFWDVRKRAYASHMKKNTKNDNNSNFLWYSASLLWHFCLFFFFILSLSSLLLVPYKAFRMTFVIFVILIYSRAVVKYAHWAHCRMPFNSNETIVEYFNQCGKWFGCGILHHTILFVYVDGFTSPNQMLIS